MASSNKDQIIKPIHTDSVHKICSGQVVLSLAVAVKELVENSLDAGATNVDIKFKNYGIDSIEVADNGYGVIEDNFSALTLKYHTSKLNEYSDLLGVTSFGFRGEALSSLCALANLTITTRHQSAQYATKVEYDHKGHITKKTPCSRQVGTTVTLTNLFHSLPVRQKEFHKNVKREFNKMTQLLYAYCLIAVGVKITCSNSTSSNQRLTVVATQGSTSFKDNIACVFGLKQLHTILEIKPEYISNIKDNIFKGLSGKINETVENTEVADVEIDLSEDSNDADITESQNTTQESISSSQKSQGYKNVVTPVEFTGFISSCAHGSGRSSSDRQFYYINSRPCEPTKIMKLINEVYRQYNPNQYPFVFLNVNLERNLVDVNVTPDKRQIFLTKEQIILDILKNSLLKLFENIPRTMKIETLSNYNGKSNEVKANLEQPRIYNSFTQKFANSNNISKLSSLPEPCEDSSNSDLKRKSTIMLDFLPKTKKAYDSNSNEHNYKTDLNYTVMAKETIIKGEIEDEQAKESNCDINNKKTSSNTSSMSKSSSTSSSRGEIMYLEATDNLPNTQIRDLKEVILETTHTVCRTKSLNSPKPHITDIKKEPNKPKKVATDKEDLGKVHRKTVVLKTSLEHVKALTDIYNSQKAKLVPERVKFKGEINPVFNKKCEEELSREIAKDSFKRMKVLGQFNLGFIITQLDDDLFIIDQHATDEIYNFETLQRTTELTYQKLVIPQQLELTGVNEQILMDNLDIFKKNGFTFDIDENAQPTKRVKLLTLPMSKNWVFGKEDIEELLFMLRESPSEHCRPSRVRAMFASRACRKSVMIGTTLSHANMKVLVDHMADIDNPWNCPHGRPTMRHLVNLAMVQTKD